MPVRLLFVKEKLSWPRSSGHDVHTYYSMQALAKQGHTVGLITLHELDEQAIKNSGVSRTYCLRSKLPLSDVRDSIDVQLSKAQEKFRSYWGIEIENILQVGRMADDFQADAVIVVGLNVLPYLGAVDRALRVWYAGDEWAWHHLSQVQFLKPASWGGLKEAALKGWYERAYGKMLDRVWMVAEPDARAIRWVAGVKSVDVLPNGVDAGYFHPQSVDELPRSCVFWGRLDFGPNIQALEWFCRNVWNKVQLQVPDAQFTIYGFQPTPVVERLVKEHKGIKMIGNLPDIRSEISKHQVVVLPFVSGGGIKNKLLEAAALGKPILCTPKTVKGLEAGNAVVSASNSSRWVEVLSDLWNDAGKRRELGNKARAWVVKDHTWDAVAGKAVQGLQASQATKVTE